MGLVVLDRDECCAPPVGEFTGIARREELGVGVVGDDVESSPRNLQRVAIVSWWYA